MSFINGKKITFEYTEYDDDEKEHKFKAIDELDIEVLRGQFIAILGHNGSGKSTFAKQLNALLTPTGGTLEVDGMDTSKEENKWKIRQTAGMVFQNPDNQIIANIVEEDVGFGPENLGLPTEKIWERVNEALKAVDMEKHRHHSPNRLSGGQKQRVAIAGVMAMHPKCIVLDEPTAMLDPHGRKEVLSAVMDLNRQENITVILITHHMDEVLMADKVYVMDDGKIVMSGTPREIFSRVDEMKKYALDVPQVTEVAYELEKSGYDIPRGILTIEEFCKAIKNLNKCIDE